MRPVHIALLLLLVIACAQMIYFNHAIDKALVAAHFNMPGNPTGLQTKLSFFALYAIVLVLGLGAWFGIPLFVKSVPERYLTLPHAEYWLAQERRERTLTSIADSFAWLGVTTLALVVVEIQIILTANLALNPHVAPLPILLPLACYMAFAAWWLLRFNRGFSQIE